MAVDEEKLVAFVFIFVLAWEVYDWDMACCLVLEEDETVSWKFVGLFLFGQHKEI